MTAQVKIYHGTPTVFINDIPYFYRLMWGSPPTTDGTELKDWVVILEQMEVK